MKTNPFVDKSIMTSKWLIDLDWGLNQFSKYFSDLELAEKHGLASLRYTELRELNQPKVYSGDTVTNGISSFKGSDGIAVLTLDGVMQVEDGWCSYGIDSLTRELQAVYDNPGLIGAVLKINSGGGSAIAAGLLRSALKEAPKPVVGLAYLMASGALYGTLPLKHVIATDPMSMIGSIGVVYSVNKELAAWYLENIDDIYATRSTEKNDAWNAYLKNDRSIFEKDADEMAAIFGDAVVDSRLLNKDQSEKALKGKTFNGQQALELNLITGFGNMSDALNLVRRQATDLKEQEQNQHLDMKITAQFAAGWNRIFPGSSVKEGDEMASLETAMAALPDSASVATMQTQITTMQTQINNLETTLSGFQSVIDAATTAATTATNAATTATTAISALPTSDEIAALTTRVEEAEAAVVNHVGVETRTDKGGKTTKPAASSVEKFEDTLSDVAEVSNEVKYS